MAWTTAHPIPWRNTSFVWLPYWVFDKLVALQQQGQDWRDYSDVNFDKYFDVLRQAYIDNTDVDFMESRNGYIYKLSAFTPVVTITAKAAAISLKIGDPDLAASALFDISPVGKAVVLTVNNSNASIVSNKVHALVAGSVTVTATAGTVTATKTITITA